MSLNVYLYKEPRKMYRKLISSTVIILSLATATGAVAGSHAISSAESLVDREIAQIPEHEMHHHGAGGMGHGMQHHGADGAGHDMVNMPGLRGLDATAEESAELAEMFRNFDRISRSVTNLPNGIRTVTSTDDPELLSTVISHVTGMIQRVDEGRDPKVFIQSPTLDILFERRDAITTDIEMTETGIIVTQTSNDPIVVNALQTHAKEVTDMVDRGMEAVHEAMQKRAMR